MLEIDAGNLQGSDTEATENQLENSRHALLLSDSFCTIKNCDENYTKQANAQKAN